MIEYYEIKIKNNRGCIFHSIIFGNNETQAYLKLIEKLQAIFIEGLQDDEILTINKR